MSTFCFEIGIAGLETTEIPSLWLRLKVQFLRISYLENLRLNSDHPSTPLEEEGREWPTLPPV